MCRTLDETLQKDIVGQDWSLRILSAQICDHIESHAPTKPLVISVHGPIGVGKSMFHRQLARALYKVHPSKWEECPGSQCPAYKVIFSMSYVSFFCRPSVS